MVPYGYCARYRRYAWHEADLPLDAHMLISLIAQRPVYVASATKDLWADPRGEFLAAKHAEPVYRLFGRAGLGVEDMPAADHPVGDFIGYVSAVGETEDASEEFGHFRVVLVCAAAEVALPNATKCTRADKFNALGPNVTGPGSGG